MRNETIYPGIVIRSHGVRDASSKLAASKSLKDWQFVEQTAAAWVSELEQGHTIQPSFFEKTPEGKYTHGVEYWQGTHFVCADADHIRGVEFAEKLQKDSDGKLIKDEDNKPVVVRDKNGVPVMEDVNPGGVESWTADKQLCRLYPDLANDCYAAVQSVSAMSDDKPPPHRRYRLIFLFYEMIKTVDHYSQVLLALSEKYPIIPAVSRAPSQPVFGNARIETGKAAITGNVLSLSDYPYLKPEPTERTAKEPAPNGAGKYNATQRKYQQDLDGLIADAKLTRHEKGADGTVRVDCPFNSGHNRDAFVGLDAGGYPYFSCHHNSCDGNGFNEMVKLTGIEVVGRPTNAERATEIDDPHNYNEKPVVMLSEVMEIDDKPVIIDKIRDVVSDDVSQHLWKNDWIYRRGVFLGTLRRGEDAPVFVKSEMLSIGGEISRTCALMKHAKKGIPSPVANPPTWLCADILYNQPVDAVREVRVVVSHPFFNGENLVAVEGYDVGTHTYLDSSFSVEMGEHTPESDLMLWKDLLQDFPFEDDSDFENAIGFALTLIVRQGLKTGEPVPLFDVTAAREGIGKSLLACTLSSAVIGYNMATDDLSSNRDEIEKVVGGILLAGREAVVFDNVDTDRPLDSGLLASIITQGKRSVRPLGTSRMAVVENRATFCCTGSNVEIKPELAKRMMAIRLADIGIPEKDRKVKIEGIQDYVLKHRGRYLSALVRMVQRWLDAGKPESENTHRMRQWSRVVRGIMEVNGFGDSFLKNSDDVMLSTSPEFTFWSNAFKEIVAQLGDTAVDGWTVKDVFHILSFEKEVYAHEKDVDSKRSFTRSAQGEGLLNELIGNAPSDQARRVKLGQLLRSKVGAVYSGYKLIDTHKSRKGAKLYAIEGVDTSGESTPF